MERVKIFIFPLKNLVINFITIFSFFFYIISLNFKSIEESWKCQLFNWTFLGYIWGTDQEAIFFQVLLMFHLETEHGFQTSSCEICKNVLRKQNTKKNSPLPIHVERERLSKPLKKKKKKKKTG